MPTHTVRIRHHTYTVLREFARDDGESLIDALDRIVEDARRSRMFRKATAAYAAIAADPEADAAWRAEIAIWDVTAGDGLVAEPEWLDDR